MGQVKLVCQHLGSIQDDVNDISDALLAAQSINKRSVTWCQVRLVCQMIGMNSVQVEFCSGSFTWCQVRLGQFAKRLGSIQDDVNDISDAQVAAKSINNDSVTWCQVRLGQFTKHLDSVHGDVTDIRNALEAAQSINEDSVTWCQVRLVRQMIGLNSVQGDVTDISNALVASQSINNDSVTWCQVRLGQFIKCLAGFCSG